MLNVKFSLLLYYHVYHVLHIIYHFKTNDIITAFSVHRATPDDEIIPYKREGSGSLVIQESMADVAVGGEFDWSTGTLINKRYYAIKAILAPGEACLFIRTIDRTIPYSLLLWVH